MIKLNGNVVEFGEYPNGETLMKSRIKMFPSGHYHHIEFSYECDRDILRLMFLKQHLGAVSVDLTIRYMPYSRLDRVEDGGMFTLKIVAALINWLEFRSVTVVEPHSDVTCALLDRSLPDYFTIEHLDEVTKMIDGWDTYFDWLFFPDAGAQKRYAKVLGYNTAVGFKHRDFATGKLSGEMDVVGFNPTDDPKVLIVDDLCSKGGTFCMSAKELRALGADKVYLFVAHCENTMWEGEVLDHIDGLYCTDSILVPPGPNNDASNRLDAEKVHVFSEGKWS